MNRRKVTICLFLLAAGTMLHAQTVLTLDSCRQLALRNNKQLNVSRLKQEVAADSRRAARTKYLPKVDAFAGYELTSKEVSILSDKNKAALSQLGTSAATSLSGSLTGLITQMTKDGLISPQTAQALGGYMGAVGQGLAVKGNELGNTLKDALRTDTRNMFAGSVMVRQPLYMGGAITALNRMADINMEMAANDIDLQLQNTAIHIEQTYWLVVSLRHKQKLAQSFHQLVQKLDTDVHKMIDEGVATRADGLRVDVSVNEAEMALMRVEDNLALAKMLLCQECGLPMESDIVLADELAEELHPDTTLPTESTLTLHRPELRLLDNAVALSEQATHLIQAAYRPQVALTGGYLISNPSVYNGFERKFSGIWNVGVVVRLPVWSWFEGRYKIRASKTATTIAEMEKTDLQEKIDLQVSQCQFNLKEAVRRLKMAESSVASADENLRCANVGFSEGVMESTDVMAAQTAWQQAHSQKIDAEIEVQLSQVALKKALGYLQ